MMKKVLTIVGALLLACSLPLSGTAASNQIFADVPATKHFAEAVNDLAERNIIGGYPDGTFKPGELITRGQAAAIIVKMVNLDVTNVKDPGYTDVSTGNGYYQAIAAMSAKGIIKGYEDGRYGPNDPVTRGQMASIIVKAFDLPNYGYLELENPFKDIITSYSHQHNIKTLYKLGITTGTTPTTYSPNTAITRGQAAKLLRTTEEAKPEMKIIRASDMKWKTLTARTYPNDNSFKVYQVPGEGNAEAKVQIVPLKEGKGLITLDGSRQIDSGEHKKYEVLVKKVDGKLTVTLKESTTILSTPVVLGSSMKSLESISLSTWDGKKVTDDVRFRVNERQLAEMYIEQPGEFIATVKEKSGRTVRYAVVATESTSSAYYGIDLLVEKNPAEYEEIAQYKGGYKINGADAANIADVTRDKSSKNLKFKVTGKKTGTFTIDYDDVVSLNFDSDPGDGESTYYYDRLIVTVETLGPIVHTTVRVDLLNP
ncbi:S-layer homology domain-containing protein [Sporosarcina ureae]|uniref:S-layer homology domain-containing protein n=1 Tax=Sporosarcina ureae TaxID=1571 RepID=UPI0026EF05BB|nr:S-layer homology domain-containing protein [Sporosarcina ureae]